jgi:hypothetical protein
LTICFPHRLSSEALKMHSTMNCYPSTMCGLTQGLLPESNNPHTMDHWSSASITSARQHWEAVT